MNGLEKEATISYLRHCLSKNGRCPSLRIRKHYLLFDEKKVTFIVLPELSGKVERHRLVRALQNDHKVLVIIGFMASKRYIRTFDKEEITDLLSERKKNVTISKKGYKWESFLPT